MLNHITIMGRLTRDPELRRTGTGVAVTNFTLAVDRDFADKQTGEKGTDFIDCVAWKHTAEFVSKYFTKGRLAAVSGRLQLRDWTDNDGNKRKAAEIVADGVYFADSNKEPPPRTAHRRRSSPRSRSRHSPWHSPAWKTTTTSCRSKAVLA